MPTVRNAVRIIVHDATWGLPLETYGDIVIIGYDADNKDKFDQLMYYTDYYQVLEDWGADSPMTKAATKIFEQRVDRLWIINAAKDDGEGGVEADYDAVFETILTKEDEGETRSDIIVPTFNFADPALHDDANAFVNFASVSEKLLVAPGYVDKSDIQPCIDAFEALDPSEWTHPIVHTNTDYTPGEIAGAVAGQLAILQPWVSDEWRSVEAMLRADLKRSQTETLEQHNINTFYQIKRGRTIVSAAKVLNGSFVDIPRTKLWLKDRIKTALLNLKLRQKAAGDRIRYDYHGLELIRTTIEHVLDYGVRRGVIKEHTLDDVTYEVKEYGYMIRMPKLEDIPFADKQARTLRDVYVYVRLVGEISTMEITLVVSV